MINLFYIVLYRVCEAIDGEHNIKVINYSIAERIKLYCLKHIN